MHLTQRFFTGFVVSVPLFCQCCATPSLAKEKRQKVWQLL
jgi:hypothetical protein